MSCNVLLSVLPTKASSRHWGTKKRNLPDSRAWLSSKQQSVLRRRRNLQKLSVIHASPPTHPQPPTPHRRPLTATLSGRLLTGQMTVKRNFEGTNSCVFMFNSEKNRRGKARRSDCLHSLPEGTRTRLQRKTWGNDIVQGTQRLWWTSIKTVPICY